MAHLKDLIVNGPARILGKIMSPVFSDSMSMGRAEGTDIGVSSVALGISCTASGEASHAEGSFSDASGDSSHAEGCGTIASGDQSHAEGYVATASGDYSHAEGSGTIASGDYSHVEGYGTRASGEAQHVEGKFNIEDTESTYLHIAGNGTTPTNRSNAHTLDWDGNAWFAGDVEADGQISSTHVNATYFQTTEGNLGIQDDGIWTTDGTLKVNAGTVAFERDIPTVYTAQQCTAYTSDSGTCTPKAVQQGAKQFAIPRVGYTSNTDKGNTTDKAIVRFSGTESDVQDSKIIIEDVTNTADTSKKAQVIAIPAEGNKKMVYGYCTDQIDGTSFIGGIFDKSATSYPYASGLAIGGTSGNLLWKGQKVVTANEVPTGFSISTTANDDDIVVLSGSGGTNSVSYTASHAKKGPSTSFTHGNTASAFSVPNISVDTYGHTTAVANGQKFIIVDTLPTASTSYNGTICIVY